MNSCYDGKIIVIIIGSSSISITASDRYMCMCMYLHTAPKIGHTQLSTAPTNTPKKTFGTTPHTHTHTHGTHANPSIPAIAEETGRWTMVTRYTGSTATRRVTHAKQAKTNTCCTSAGRECTESRAHAGIAVDSRRWLAGWLASEMRYRRARCDAVGRSTRHELARSVARRASATAMLMGWAKLHAGGRGVGGVLHSFGFGSVWSAFRNTP